MSLLEATVSNADCCVHLVLQCTHGGCSDFLVLLCPSWKVVLPCSVMAAVSLFKAAKFSWCLAWLPGSCNVPLATVVFRWRLLRSPDGCSVPPGAHHDPFVTPVVVALLHWCSAPIAQEMEA
jgi:hypothetical protein